MYIKKGLKVYKYIMDSDNDDHRNGKVHPQGGPDLR